MIKIGDIFKLGEHRLGCGNAMDADFVKRVVGGSIIRQHAYRLRTYQKKVYND